MPVVALSSTAIIALVAGSVVALAFAAAIVGLVLRGRPPAKPDIPASMRPGPADEVLERRLIERFTGWSLIFVIFFAAWIPVLWLREPNTNSADAVELTDRSVERGERWFAISDENNPTGFGCARCHGPAGQGGQTIPFMGAAVQPPPLNNVCGGEESGHPAIASLEDIRTTIEEGREGTAMPSWSVQFEGPMNDQQIDDLINYLISIQEEMETNVCTEAPVEGAGDAS